MRLYRMLLAFTMVLFLVGVLCVLAEAQQAPLIIAEKKNIPKSPTEDCVSFSPATTTVKQIQNSWKIVDGAHWMFDFGTNKAAADQALAVI
jgi:hypothetical protein